MRSDPGSGKKKPPRSVNRRYTCDITASRDTTIGKVFDEADRRDPGHARTWIALVDGDVHQISLVWAQATARGIMAPDHLDRLYPRAGIPAEAAWCFHAPAT